MQTELVGYLDALRGQRPVADHSMFTALVVPKDRVAASGNYNLSGERYREDTKANHHFPLVSLGDEDLFRVDSGGTPKSDVEEYWGGGIPWATLVDLPPTDFISEISSTKRTISERGLAESSAKMIPENSVIVSTRATIGRIAINRVSLSTNQGFKNVVILDQTRAVSEYIALALTKLVPIMQAWATGGTFPEISKSKFCELKIPLPPLDVQKEIVAEIEGYQKVINGARAVLDNYRPHIAIAPEWPTVDLSEICTFKNGLNFNKASSGHRIKIIGVSDFQSNLFVPVDDLDELHLDAPIGDDYLVTAGDILFVRSNGNPDLVGRSMIAPELPEPTTFSGFTIRGRIEDPRAMPLFYAHFFKSRDFAEKIKTVGQGANIRNLSQGILNELKVPLPPIKEQESIVAEITAEQVLVDGNRKLIAAFEKKIQGTLARVWGEEPAATVAGAATAEA